MTERRWRIHHVVPSIASNYGGPSRSVPALCNELAALGHEVTLHTYGPAPNPLSTPYAVRAYRRWPSESRFGLSLDLFEGLRDAARHGDVLHVHGLWTFSSLAPAWAARGTSCRLVFAPRGMLDPWALRQSAYRKRVVWVAAQRWAANAAHLLHATAFSEAQAIRSAGLSGPIGVVPNGVDIPPADDVARFEGSPRTLLFLSRLHPKKGLDRLLGAWADVQAEFPDWRLHIVGPDNNDYAPKLRRLIAERGAERVQFFGAAVGAEKTAHYRSAQLFILPTHSENFGLVVAEALSHGLPVIVGRGAPWQGIAARGCGYWIDNSEAEIAACLRDALARSPDELRARGALGRAWMQQEFSWRQVAESMAEVYAWLLDAAPRPATVQLGDIHGAA